MQKIAVGVITFQRPLELERLLDGIARQHFVAVAPQPEVTVVVVDNATQGSARAVCDQAIHRHGLKISYIFEPKQSIPVARNRVLDSLPDGCEGVVWVDDDEVPATDWLEALILTFKASGADIILGAIEGVLPEGAPEWVRKGGFFNRRRFVDRASFSEGATNNCLMVVDSIRQHGLRFDESLRYAGGTDTLFFKVADVKGLRMVWSSKALVYDHIRLERTNLRWLIHRHFRSGVSLAIADWHASGVLGGVRRFGMGVYKILQGLLNLPVGLEGMHEMARTLMFFSRGFGMIVGLMGYRLNEFKPERSAIGTEKSS